MLVAFTTACTTVQAVI